ncbi:MAG: response regulator [Candidatus Scalindua sp.]
MEKILVERRKDYQQEVHLIIAEDDEGHAALIMKNLKRAGFKNDILHCKDGQEVLDFLFLKGEGPHRISGKSYLLLLDIRMPKVDGVEVLRQLKKDPELSKMPVIMVTTTDDPREVNHCHELGCSIYVTKPVDYEKFIDAIKKLGLFLTVIKVPRINGIT